MSTLKADTIQSTGGGAATLTKQSAAKAWLSMDSSGGGTTTFHGSFNTSTVTDSGVGLYVQNFTNSFTGANYSGGGATVSNVYANLNVNTTTYTASASGLVTFNVGASYVDVDVCTAFHGDLA